MLNKASMKMEGLIQQLGFHGRGVFNLSGLVYPQQLAAERIPLAAGRGAGGEVGRLVHG